jgi:pimeloyl-ACP methyl ester carboxylesterase
MQPTHYDLAVLCNDSYDSSRTDIWSVAENDALVRQRGGYTEISCRGTEMRESVFAGNFSINGIRNARDVFKDLRFWPYSMPNGSQVHKGFGRAAVSWCERYALRLAKINKPIILTGHSLGAAMAVQMAAILKWMNLSVAEVVVFGEPASFYWKAEERYRAMKIPTTSYLNENDWIQFAPPWGSTSVERTYLNKKPGLSRAAHGIERYMAALENRNL